MEVKQVCGAVPGTRHFGDISGSGDVGVVLITLWRYMVDNTLAVYIVCERGATNEMDDGHHGMKS